MDRFFSARTFFFLSSLFALYATTIPWDIAHRPNLWRFDFSRIGPTFDLVQNVVLFLPVGFFGALAFPARALAIVFYGLFLSLGLELLQTMSAERRPALSDVFTNTLGTAIGAAIAIAYSRYAHARLVNAIRDVAARKPGHLVIAALVAIAISFGTPLADVPLYLAIAFLFVRELRRPSSAISAIGALTRERPALVLAFSIATPTIRALYPFERVSPWEKLSAVNVWSFVPFSTLFSNLTPVAFTNVFEAALFYVPLGWALGALGQSPRRVFIAAVLLAEVLEVLQLFVEGRTFDPTEGLYAGISALFGAWALSHLGPTLAPLVSNERRHILGVPG